MCIASCGKLLFLLCPNMLSTIMTLCLISEQLSSDISTCITWVLICQVSSYTGNCQSNKGTDIVCNLWSCWIWVEVYRVEVKEKLWRWMSKWIKGVGYYHFFSKMCRYGEVLIFRFRAPAFNLWQLEEREVRCGSPLPGLGMMVILRRLCGTSSSSNIIHFQKVQYAKK